MNKKIFLIPLFYPLCVIILYFIGFNMKEYFLQFTFIYLILSTLIIFILKFIALNDRITTLKRGMIIGGIIGFLGGIGLILTDTFEHGNSIGMLLEAFPYINFFIYLTSVDILAFFDIRWTSTSFEYITSCSFFIFDLTLGAFSGYLYGKISNLKIKILFWFLLIALLFVVNVSALFSLLSSL